MSDPTSAPPPLPSSMTTADRELLAHAADLYRPIARAARLGRANGMGYAIFGVLSLTLAAMQIEVAGLVLGAVLLGIGVFERRQCARLLHADLAALERLAGAELTLLVAIVLYGVLRLTVLPSAADSLTQQLGDTRRLGIDVQSLTESINRAWYGTLIAVSLLYQGGMARYFHRRREAVTRYRQTVPNWARELVEKMAD